MEWRRCLKRRGTWMEYGVTFGHGSRCYSLWFSSLERYLQDKFVRYIPSRKVKRNVPLSSSTSKDPSDGLILSLWPFMAF